MFKIVAPELGEGIEKATVACWHKSVGERVSREDDIAELVTDKATFNVPAGVSGTLKEICVVPGREIRIGDTLAVVEKSHD
jgi:pyruvate/2-oxoglutarate dehydrogenase complex dihydrolipoamide acyltransferase (E2) component